MKYQLKEKSFWQQLIPLYGIYKATKDILNDKSSIIDHYFISGIYHGICCILILDGLEKLLQ